MIIWICGPSGAGKTTLAQKLSEGINAYHLDADECRKEWPHLGYTRRDREASCNLLAQKAANLDGDVIVSAIAPYRGLREDLSKRYGILFIQVDHEGSKGRDDDASFEDIEGKFRRHRRIGIYY
jgi:adenylylsulfate kinase-like enzyme